MAHDCGTEERRQERAAFACYLRTGRRSVSSTSPTLESKFNPWHDPRDGRFTFAGAGTFAGGVARGAEAMRNGVRYSKPPTQDSARRRALDTRLDAASAPTAGRELNDPKNTSPYVVEKGDSLSRIAATRRGLTATILAKVNGVPVDGVLRVGQKLKVPTQAYLDAVAARIEQARAAAYYVVTGGALQDVDVAHLPSVEQQVSRTVRSYDINGYRYDVDGLLRTAGVSGDLTIGITAPRSRPIQAAAGGIDRLKTDEGGHFIAARFNGPPNILNHFAQDANFNKSAYKSLENKLEKIKKSGRSVHIEVVPHYPGFSLRPDHLTVYWIVDGKRESQGFDNKKGVK